MQEKIYKVYKITNLVNGKIYIGETYKPIEKRFSEHVRKAFSKGKKYPINSAIKKYGQENFKIEVLEDGFLTKKEVQIKETEYILQYKSYIQKIGYNLKIRSKERFYNDETRLKMRKSLQKRTNCKNKTGYRNIDTFKYKDGSTGYRVYVYSGKSKGKAYSRTFKSIEEGSQWYDRVVLCVYGPDAYIQHKEKRGEYLELNKINSEELFVSRRPKKTIYRGVSFTENKKQFTCQIEFKGQHYHFGYYDTEIEAAIVNDKMALYLGRSINFFNFPDKIEEYKKDLENIEKSFIYYSTQFKNRIRNKHGYRGVFQDSRKPLRCYYARIELNNKQILSDFFDNTMDAAIGYDKLAVTYFGNKAKTNFPIENYINMNVSEPIQPTHVQP